jgi:uncharacterized protein (TIGR02271 family)
MNWFVGLMYITYRKLMDKEKQAMQENFEPQPEEENMVIPVIEEEVIIDKKVVKKASIYIHKKVNTEDVLVEVPVTSDKFTIERIAVNKYLDTPPPEIRHEGDTIIIPVIKEVIVKRILLVEEIHMTKHVQKDIHKKKLTLKKESVTITREDK